MTVNAPPFSNRSTDPLSAALHSALLLERQGLMASPSGAPNPFVTISRQAGAGGKTLGRALVDRLNANSNEHHRWTLWDDELVRKVAQEHAMAEEYVEAMEDQPHGWFHDFLHGLPFSGVDRHPDEFKVYRRVASTIRALARAGRAVIVGRGGAFITADLPGGVHLRIVAPAAQRVQQMAELMQISPERAVEVVRDIDHNRAQFYHRYWPRKSMDAESFTMTLNSGKLEIEQMVACMMPLLQTADPVRRSRQAALQP